MGRLNIERQAKVEPRRIAYAKKKIEQLGFTVAEIGRTRLQFMYKSEMILFYPYSGWASGKTINDGRGLEKLLKQIS